MLGKEAEYNVEEDNIYHIGVLNMNSRNIILTMKVNVLAKVHDPANQITIRHMFIICLIMI